MGTIKKLPVQKISDLEKFTDQDYNSWNCDFLADYIVRVHHQYVINAIPQIRSLIEAVIGLHGKDHPELEMIQDYFRLLSNEMLQHMRKEELVLFPLIKKFVWAEAEGMPVDAPHFGSVKNPIELIEKEHITCGIFKEKLLSLSNDYLIHEDSGDSFRELYWKMIVFDANLQLHVHLEDDILHQKARAIEKRILSV